VVAYSPWGRRTSGLGLRASLASRVSPMKASSQRGRVCVASPGPAGVRTSNRRGMHAERCGRALGFVMKVGSRGKIVKRGRATTVDQLLQKVVAWRSGSDPEVGSIKDQPYSAGGAQRRPPGNRPLPHPATAGHRQCASNPSEANCCCSSSHARRSPPFRHLGTAGHAAQGLAHRQPL